MEAWSEHPYRDIVDNRVDFDNKVKLDNNILVVMITASI